MKNKQTIFSKFPLIKQNDSLVIKIYTNLIKSNISCQFINFIVFKTNSSVLTQFSSSGIRPTNTFHSFLVICDVTSAWLTVVANISHVSHVDVFSFFFPDDKSHLYVAFWSLAFRSSSEEHRWVDFTRVFWSHVIILEAQTAPWVAFFNFAEEDSSPVSTQ